jgi:hypothetical protein
MRVHTQNTHARTHRHTHAPQTAPAAVPGGCGHPWSRVTVIQTEHERSAETEAHACRPPQAALSAATGGGGQMGSAAQAQREAYMHAMSRDQGPSIVEVRLNCWCA